MSGSEIFDAVMKRPLPSFEQWLDDNGDGSRGDGFEAMEDLARRTQEQKGAFSANEQSLLRMWQGFSIAVVEICRIENSKHGRDAAQITILLPRVLALAAMYATASALKNDAPWRPVAKIMTEEFRAIAKLVADDLERRM